jgi:hypothetical protein
VHDVRKILNENKTDILHHEYRETGEKIQKKIDYFFMPYNYQMDYSKGLNVTDDNDLSTSKKNNWELVLSLVDDKLDPKQKEGLIEAFRKTQGLQLNERVKKRPV